MLVLLFCVRPACATIVVQVKNPCAFSTRPGLVTSGGFISASGGWILFHKELIMA